MVQAYLPTEVPPCGHTPAGVFGKKRVQGMKILDFKFLIFDLKNSHHGEGVSSIKNRKSQIKNSLKPFLHGDTARFTGARDFCNKPGRPSPLRPLLTLFEEVVSYQLSVKEI